MEQKPVEKMGTVPVRKLMLSMGVPVIISMMLQALYNTVDSAFVSNREKASAVAAGLIFNAYKKKVKPLQN